MFQTNTPYFDCYFGYYSKSPRLYFQPSQVTGSHKVMVNLFQHLPFVPFVITVPVVILECSCGPSIEPSPWKAVVQGLVAFVCCFAFSVIPVRRHPGVSLSFLCHFALRTYKKGPAKYCREPPIPQNIYKHTL